jgi:hypothetical protein
LSHYSQLTVKVLLKNAWSLSLTWEKCVHIPEPEIVCLRIYSVLRQKLSMFEREASPFPSKERHW